MLEDVVQVLDAEAGLTAPVLNVPRRELGGLEDDAGHRDALVVLVLVLPVLSVLVVPVLVVV